MGICFLHLINKELTILAKKINVKYLLLLYILLKTANFNKEKNYRFLEEITHKIYVNRGFI